MKVDSSYFKNVPISQFNILNDFVQNNNYTKIIHEGIEYEYLSLGEGEKVLVFLSGAMFTPYMWFYQMQNIKDTYKIIAPNFPTVNFGANETVSYLKTIMDIEKVKTATIIGYSYGGGIAQYFAEIYPERIDYLVLSHTGVLIRENSIERIESFLKKIKVLPNFAFGLIKAFRTKSGKDSKWFQFRKAFFSWMTKNLEKADFINHFESSLKFAKEVSYMRIGDISWDGPTIILGTKTDTDTFEYFDTLKSIYTNNKSWIFNQSGGHHMIFLYPEVYTNALRKLFCNK